MATNLATNGLSVIFESEVWASDLARLAGFEPATRCLEGSCSIRLSYRRFTHDIVQEQGHAEDTSRHQAGGSARDARTFVIMG